MRVRSVMGGGLAACALVAVLGVGPGSASAGADGPGFVTDPGFVAGPDRALPEGTWLPWTPGPPAQAEDGPDLVVPEGEPMEGVTAGTLDTSLAHDGTLTPNFVTGPEDAASLAIQPDGKIVVGGGAGSGNSRVQVARFNADGTRDTTFGGGDGAVQKNISPGQDWIEDIALQPDGKIVVVGSASGVSFVMRFDADGTLDTEFGVGGYRLLVVGRGYNVATSVVVDSAGRIAFAGRGGEQGGRFVVARVDSAGDPDAGFSDEGIKVINFTAGDDVPFDLALRSFDRLVAVGVAGTSPSRIAVLALGATGNTDSGFNGSGRQTVAGPGQALATSVAVQDENHFVLGGYSSLNGGQMLVGRILSNATMDSGFGTQGFTTVDFGPGDDFAWRVAIGGDGSIVAAGGAAGAGGRFAVARVTSTGAPDTTFSGDGKLTTNLTPGADEAHSVALDADGDIVASGIADGASSNARIAVARYLGS